MGRSQKSGVIEMKTKKDIADHVNILLREGIDATDQWMTIKPFKAQTGVGGDFWEAEYQMLNDHHVQETKFLFEVIKELIRRLELKEALYDAALEELSADYQ